MPEITILFWVMKICATTLGETAGDLLSMTLNVGYAAASVILFTVFLASLAGQLRSTAYHPVLYWTVILTTSTAGTTMSDFIDRTLGIGYASGSALLIGLLLTTLFFWLKSEKSLSVADITTRSGELFYWTAILFSNTLGTALGDFLADDSGLGFAGGAVLIGALLALVVLAFYFTKISHVALFWAAFVLTRPFGATFGDLLTKPLEKGGLGFGTAGSSLVLFGILAALIFWTLKSHKKATVLLLFPLVLVGSGSLFGQNASTADRLLLVTSDGIRWQEVFKGADSTLLFNPKWVPDTAFYRKKYWAKTAAERRQKLMPFLWSVVEKEGQIHGNRRLGSRVRVSNPVRISYPGYAEILTGRVDPRIFDNHPWRNRSKNVLDFLAETPEFEGKTAAFASWSNLYFALGGSKTDLAVNAGSIEPCIKNWKKDPPPEHRKFWSPAILNTINRHDTITWRLADQFFEKEKPSVLYVSLMESDLEAHKGRYDRALDAIHRLDSLLGNLWQKMQSDPNYRGRTALFLTTDHGRGAGGFMSDWRLHNQLTRGSQQIWFAVMSPDLLPLGEVAGSSEKIKATQFAQTIARLLGHDFDKKHRGTAICFQETMLPKSSIVSIGSQNRWHFFFLKLRSCPDYLYQITNITHFYLNL